MFNRFGKLVAFCQFVAACIFLMLGNGDWALAAYLTSALTALSTMEAYEAGEDKGYDEAYQTTH